MNRCPSCDYPLPHDRERIGARCPSCRDPLYEPPGRVSRFAREDEGACALHAGRETVGTCGRCGNYFCEVCRTRWRDQILCAACAERALASREATPEQARAHFRQALLGLVLSLGSWPVFILGQVSAIGFAFANRNVLLALLALVLVVSAVLMAVVGTGQAAAALRTRGHHMIMATSGFLIGGLFLGIFIGNYVLQLWIT
ncbi:MAG TPA: hypothetical protein VMG10_08045 [Gemmataceae bacterium]|nr:hypothetical protein [Gemmataceae bacterium]